MNSVILKDMVRLITVGLLLAGFLVAGNPWLLHASTDDMMLHESMPGCSLMGMTAVCQMNPLEHIGMWQSLLTFLPQTQDLLALLLSLLLLTFGFLWLRLLPKSIQRVRLRQYLQKNYIPPSHPLQELFSSGILHSKAF